MYWLPNWRANQFTHTQTHTHTRLITGWYWICSPASSPAIRPALLRYELQANDLPQPFAILTRLVLSLLRVPRIEFDRVLCILSNVMFANRRLNENCCFMISDSTSVVACVDSFCFELNLFSFVNYRKCHLYLHCIRLVIAQLSIWMFQRKRNWSRNVQMRANLCFINFKEVYIKMIVYKIQ